MIESRYWKIDLLNHARDLRPVSKPPRWSEKLQVNFEKKICISFFMVRKLMESTKLSSKSLKYKAHIFRSKCNVADVHNLNFWDIDTIYDLDNEEKVFKNLRFVTNQLIHSGALFGFRKEDRNWGGIYTCSDYERAKYVYKIPIEEIIKILNLVGNDYPHSISYTFSDKKKDYIITTN